MKVLNVLIALAAVCLTHAHPGPECKINVQFFGNDADDVANNVGFIEVNGNYTSSWFNMPAENKDGPIGKQFAVSVISPQCQVITTAYIVDPADVEGTFIEEFNNFLKSAPDGSYVAMARLEEVDESAFDIVFLINKYQFLMEIGFSDESIEWDSVGANTFNLTSGYGFGAVFVKRGKVPFSSVKSIGAEVGPRKMTVTFPINGDACVGPMPNQELFNPLPYGVGYGVGANDEMFDDEFTTDLSVDLTNMITCNTGLMGFMYYPQIYADGSGDPVSKDVNFTMWRYDSPNLSRVATFGPVSVETHADVDSLPEMQYLCLRHEDSIFDAMYGDYFGMEYDSPNDTVNVIAEIPGFDGMSKLDMLADSVSDGVWPCSEPVTFINSHLIAKIANATSTIVATDLTANTTDFPATFRMQGLRPILNKGFVYTCPCSSDDECQMYGDYHTMCDSGECGCKTDYAYDSNTHKCIFVKTTSLPDVSATMISSFTNDDVEDEAAKAIDDNDDVTLMAGTCAMSLETDDDEPYLIVDMGTERSVLGVTVTTPEPLDIWAQLEETSGSNVAFVHQDIPNRIDPEGMDDVISNSDIVSDVDILKVNGPFPYKAYSGYDFDAASDSFVLNREHTDGLHEWTSSEVGTLSTNTRSIRRIELFGYITSYDGHCWSSSGSELSLIDTGLPDDNSFSNEPTPFLEAGCTEFYIEEASGSSYYIRRLSDDFGLKFDGTEDNTEAEFAADSTTVTIADLEGLLDGTSTTIALSQDSSFNIETDNSVYLYAADASDEQKLRFIKYIPDEWPRYEYALRPGGNSSNGTSVDLQGEYNHYPCVSVFSVPGIPFVSGHVLSVTSNANTSIWSVEVETASSDGEGRLSESDPQDVFVRASEPGLNSFMVGVMKTYDSGPPTDFQECKYYPGSPINGIPLKLSCEEPLTGRYVAIVREEWEMGYGREHIQLCDIQIHSLSTTYYGQLCSSDEDCLVQADDQHIVCKDMDDSFQCLCDDGYYFHEPAVLCVDLNECLDEDTCTVMDEVMGQVNGTCQNMLGGFMCECPTGYFMNETATPPVCQDIDECEVNNGLCEGGCTNMYLDDPENTDQIMYECECVSLYPDGNMRLSDNGHDCVDVDECTEYDMYVGGDKANGCEYVFEMSTGCSPPYCNIYNMGTCKNTWASFECLCSDGYMREDLNSSMGHCVDINECLYPDWLYPGSVDLDMTRCEDECMNLVPDLHDAKYVCSCDNLDGYELDYYEEGCIDINECERETDDCSAGSANVPTNDTSDVQGECENHVGYFACLCPDGYLWHQGNERCEDIDECAMIGLHDCEDNCTNTNGSYMCHCHEGYKLLLNGHSCGDLDECDPDEGVNITCHDADESQDGIEDGMCMNTIGSYTCMCPDGFMWNMTSLQCENIDECANGNNGYCQDLCEDMMQDRDNMPYQCICTDPGYKVSNDFFTCVDMDECVELHPENGTSLQYCDAGSSVPYNATEPEEEVMGMCMNTVGSFMCMCPMGYRWDMEEMYCMDIDECMEGSSHCEMNCTNTFGSYSCSCNEGFMLNANHMGCMDIDECATMQSDCNQTCSNELGYYTCGCHPGYELSEDEHMCDDVDECERANGGCDQMCDNNMGSFECVCDDGFFLLPDGEDCDDMDECEEEKDDCSQICKNTKGGFDCACEPGFKLDEDDKTCIDADECEDDNGGCAQECENTDGSYVCSCAAGYLKSENGRDCNDIDECTRDNPCESFCKNSIGGYTCSCPNGYDILDEVKCEGPNFVVFRFGLKAEFMTDYGDSDAPAAQALRQELEDKFDDIFGKNPRLIAEEIIAYEIIGDFRKGSVYFDLAIRGLGPMSTSQQAYIASILWDVLRNSDKLTVNGEEVEFAEQPQMVYTSPQGVSTAFPVNNPCDLYVNTDYCQNGGSCKLALGRPQCDCPWGYAGSNCNGDDGSSLSVTEVSLISTLVIIFIILLILALCVCCLCFRRRANNVDSSKEPVEVIYDYDDGTGAQTNGASWYPNYYSNGYGWSYSQ